MLDHNTGRIIVLGAGLAALSALPGASAAKVCTETSTGEEVCRDTLPKQAKIAIALVTITVIFLLLAVFFFVRRSRQKSLAAERETSIDESQMTGPATVLRATYNPGSGHSIYAIGSAGSPAIPTAVIPPTASPAPVSISLDTPSMPIPTLPASPRTVSQPKTAPAHRSTFSNGHPYPFSANGSAMGSASGNPPKSAFVSGGFPRPLLAGRLKDRIRERPPSASSLTQEFPSPSRQI